LLLSGTEVIILFYYESFSLLKYPVAILIGRLN